MAAAVVGSFFIGMKSFIAQGFLQRFVAVEGLVSYLPGLACSVWRGAV